MKDFTGGTVGLILPNVQPAPQPTYPNTSLLTPQGFAVQQFHGPITTRHCHTPGLKFGICQTTQWPFKPPALCKTPLRSLKAERRQEAVVSSLKRTLIVDIQHKYYSVSWINAPNLFNLIQLYFSFFILLIAMLLTKLESNVFV